MQNLGKRFTLKAGLPGAVVSAAVITARALNSSVPVEDWSFASWILMLVPVMWPLYVFAALTALWLIGEAVLLTAVAAADCIRKLRKRRPH